MPFDPIGLANETGRAAAFEARVLDELERAIGFDAAFFAVNGARATTRNIDGARLEAAFAAAAYADELAPVKAAAAARGVAVDTRVLGERAVRALRYHRDFAAPIGGRHSLIAVLALRGRAIGGILLGRCGATFSDAHVALVEGLLVPLAVARASFHLPWAGAPLRDRGAQGVARMVARLRGQHERARTERPSGALVVRDRAGYREMIARERDGSELTWTRAALDEPERSGWFYVELLHLAAVRAPARGRVLFVGCGGGVALRQFAQVYPGVRLDLVESDPDVLALARRWFDLDALPDLTVALDDGAAFVAHAPAGTWDAIVVDAFDGTAIASPFVSRAFFAAARRALRPGGGLALNLIGALAGGGPVREAHACARAELEDVRLVPVLDPQEAYSPAARRNVVLVARAFRA